MPYLQSHAKFTETRIVSRVRVSSPAPVSEYKRVPTKFWVSTKFGDGVVFWGLLTALSDNAQPVVREVFKAIGTTLDEFEFAMQAFGAAIHFKRSGSDRIDSIIGVSAFRSRLECCPLDCPVDPSSAHGLASPNSEPNRTPV